MKLYMAFGVILIAAGLAHGVEPAATDPVTVPETVYAEQEPVESAFTLTISPEIWSQYLYYGSIVSEDAVFQTDVYLEHESGFYLGVWWSSGNDTSFSSDGADELDYYVGWSGGVGSVADHELWLDVGVIYYDLIDLGQFEDDFVGLYAEVSTDIEISEIALSPFLRVEHQFPVNKTEDYEGGAIVDLGVRHSWEISEKWTLDQELKIFYDAGIAGLDSGFFLEYGGGLSWQMNDWLVVSPIKVRAVTPMSDIDDGRESELVIGAGATLTF